MRGVFAKSATDSRASIAEGTFDKTGVENGWADVIIIAQVSEGRTCGIIISLTTSLLLKAFHWCPDFDAALTEFARVLKPDGVVVFIWNLEDRCVLRPVPSFVVR